MQFNSLIQILCAQIDNQFEHWLNILVKATNYQELYARWHALYQLVNIVPCHKKVKLKIFNSHQQELEKDLTDEHVHLFKIVYQQEFDQAGGEAFSLLALDFSIDQHKLKCWSTLANIAASSFCVTISTAESIPSTYNAHWKNFRENYETGFLGIILGKIKVSDIPSSDPLTKNNLSQYQSLYKQAIWHYIEQIILCFDKQGWFYPINESIKNSYNPGISVIDQRSLCKKKLYSQDIDKLHEEGIIGISESLYFNQIFFSTNLCIHSNKQRNGIETLDIALCFGRIAHYLKILLRNKLSSLGNYACEQYLQNWILNYCSRSSAFFDNELSQHPFESAKIMISNKKIGKLQCYFELQFKKNHTSLNRFININSIIAL